MKIENGPNMKMKNLGLGILENRQRPNLEIFEDIPIFTKVLGIFWLKSLKIHHLLGLYQKPKKIDFWPRLTDKSGQVNNPVG